MTVRKSRKDVYGVEAAKSADALTLAQRQAQLDQSLYRSAPMTVRYFCSLQPTLLNGQMTRINFNNKDWDSENLVTVGDSWVLQARQKGVYQINVSLQIQSSQAGEAFATLRVGPYEIRRGTRTTLVAGSWRTVALDSLVRLNEGSQLYVLVYQSSGANQTLEPDNTGLGVLHWFEASWFGDF